MSYTEADQQAFSFFQRAYEIETIDELQGAFAAAVANWGVTRFSVTQVVTSGESPPEPRLLFGHRFDEWDVRYAEAGYFAHDPCVPRFFRGRGAFTWRDVRPLTRDKRGEAMFEEVRQIGLQDGMIVPIVGGEGEILCARLMCEQPIQDPASRGVLEGLATVYATAGLKILQLGGESISSAHLSPREIECLFWVGHAKSDDEIGAKLGISGNTVHTHVERAKRKMKVATRGIAAAKARQQGLFVRLARSM